MKIYKVSQNIQQPIIPQKTQQSQEVNAALQKLMYCAQTINQSLTVLENYDITNLLKKNSLIAEIQSGNLANLNQTNIQASVDAMAKISLVIPTYNAAMKVLRDSGADFNQLNNSIIALINQGATVQTSDLSIFQNALPSASGIQMPSNLSQ
jgi:hypothetical protein